MDVSYPQTGFHFSVVFELFPQLPNDLRFQDVSGLTATMDMETIREGGENRFAHQLPTRTNYTELVLKRGITALPSFVYRWCNDAIANFIFKPTNILVSLLDENHLPLYNWYVINAIPKKLEVSSFNAERSEIVIETMTLQYQYFKYYDPAGLAVELASKLTGSVSFSIT